MESLAQSLTRRSVQARLLPCDPCRGPSVRRRFLCRCNVVRRVPDRACRRPAAADFVCARCLNYHGQIQY